MTNPLRVVFLDHTTQLGGAELALSRLIRTQQRWIATVIAPRTMDEDAFSDLPGDVNVLRTGSSSVAISSSPNKLAATLRTLTQIIEVGVSAAQSRPVKDCDLIVANTTRSSVYSTAIGLIRRKKMVVHIRDLIEAEAIGRAATTLMRRFVLPRAAGVIANSRASLDSVRPHLNSGVQITVLPSPSGLVLKPQSEEVASSTVRRIGMVARLDPWKGQDLLIRAFAQAFPQDDTRLILAGSPAFGHSAYDAELERLAAEVGVADRVEFVGHVQDVPGLIASLDVCVQSSIRAEPLGQNVLQYLAAGKPTIVSAEGGPAEWVVDGENGLQFAPRSVAELRNKLLLIARDAPLRRKIARNGPMTPGLESDQQIGDRIYDFFVKVASA